MTDKQRLAAAKDIPTSEMVDVLSVADGLWRVRGQWSGNEHTRTFSDLHGVWPDSDVMEAVASMARKGATPEDMYAKLINLTNNPEWSQLLLRIWVESWDEGPTRTPEDK